MNLDNILSFVESGNIDKLKSTLEVSKLAYFINDAFANSGKLNNVTTGAVNNKDFNSNDYHEYNTKLHKVKDESERPNKILKSENSDYDNIVKVARIPIPEQKKIVLFASAFLGVPTLSATPQQGIEADMFSVINTISVDNKLDYKFKEITKRTMSERESAELWYTQDAEADYWDGTPMESKFKLRMRVISPALGDTLYPCWDEYGDMVAFGRYYETIETVAAELESTSNTVYHFDIYTADKLYFMQKTGNDEKWSYINPDGSVGNSAGIKNEINKIPIIYYSQSATEWYDVQEMIERLEKKTSNHADTNDYFDSPIVVAKGKINTFVNKGDEGKYVEADNGADLSYLTWDNAPESMKMEIDNLTKYIHTYTHTPDISFDNIKGLGTFTGIALKMFFMDAHIKAADKEEIFGQSVQRRINFLKAAVAVLNSKFKPALRLIIKPAFNYFLPKDTDGEVATIVKAYQAGILSLETAVKLNPLVEDSIAEFELIKEEKAAAAKVVTMQTANENPVKSVVTE